MDDQTIIRFKDYYNKFLTISNNAKNYWKDKTAHEFFQEAIEPTNKAAYSFLVYLEKLFKEINNAKTYCESIKNNIKYE